MGLPTNSPVRLGVSSAAASIPTGVFNQRFEALFPHTGTVGCAVCLASQLFLPVYLHMKVGQPSLQSATSQGLPAATLPALVLQLLSCHESSSPGCPSPPLLPVWMNVSSLTPLLWVFYPVQFSGSSGCFLCLTCCCLSLSYVRRQGVSTYASILAGSPEPKMVIL